MFDGECIVQCHRVTQIVYNEKWLTSQTALTSGEIVPFWDASPESYSQPEIVCIQ